MVVMLLALALSTRSLAGSASAHISGQIISNDTRVCLVVSAGLFQVLETSN